MATSFPCLESGDTRIPFAVLGHFPTYIGVARTLGAEFFYIPNNKLTGMSEDDLWCHNRQFLRSVIAGNGHFLLSTKSRDIRRRSWLARELEYLEQHSARLFAIDGVGVDLRR